MVTYCTSVKYQVSTYLLISVFWLLLWLLLHGSLSDVESRPIYGIAPWELCSSLLLFPNDGIEHFKQHAYKREVPVDKV